MKLVQVTIAQKKNKKIIGTSYNPGIEHEIPISWEDYLQAEKERLESLSGCIHEIKKVHGNFIALYASNNLILKW
jgi:hypothetical protein